MVKYRNYLIIGLFAASLAFPLISSAQSLPFTPEFRTSLLSLLQKISTLQSAPLSSPTPVLNTQINTPISSGQPLQLKSAGNCSPPDENTKPFGGYSNSRPFSCNCSSGYLIYVGAPRGGTFHITPSTRVCQYGAPVNNWVLGNYYPGTGNDCWYVTGDDCSKMPNDGIVQMLGTSN